MGHGDARFGDQRRQVVRVAVTVRCRDHQLRTGLQGPEQFPHRDVECDGRFLQHDVRRFERVGALHPLEPVDYRTMRYGNTFRTTGGAGGEEDVGDVVRAERRNPIAVGNRAGRCCAEFDIENVDIRRQVTVVSAAAQDAHR